MIFQNEIFFFNVSGISVFISFWLYAGSWLNHRLSFLRKLGSFFLFLSLITLVVALVFRGIALKFFPLANLYESLLMLACALIISYLFLEWKYDIGSFGWIVSGFLLVVYLYASWLPESQKAITPLVPALRSYWRVIHVPPLLMSYSLFLIGALSSCGYLIETMILKRKRSPGTSPSYGIVIKDTFNFFDETTYRSITFGFPLLTFGVITGALWANHAWGALWQWDPKETMALVTWFVYAAYLHFRINTRVSKKVLALISVLGIIMVYLTYLGVNQFNFGGLHTYGKIE